MAKKLHFVFKKFEKLQKKWGYIIEVIYEL